MSGQNNGGGWVVRMPKPRQIDRAQAVFGAARFHEFEDTDALVKRALDDGRLEVEWDFVAFDEDSMPKATRVPQLVSYGQYQSDPDRVLTHRDRYDSPTWRSVRKGRPPSFFATKAEAEETAQEHLETAKHFGLVTGQLKFFQAVEVGVWEATVRKDPTDRIQRRQTEIEARIAKREAEEATAKADAIEASLKESKPAPNAGDWHNAGERQVQRRVRSGGATLFRARVANRTSPSFDTIEQAIAWRDKAAKA